LFFEKQVRIQRRGIDRYGRTLGNVYVDDLWVNFKLVEVGLAWHYKKYSADVELADAEVKARAEKVGIWSRADAIPPWEFRHRPKAAVRAAIQPAIGADAIGAAMPDPPARQSVGRPSRIAEPAAMVAATLILPPSTSRRAARNTIVPAARI